MVIRGVGHFRLACLGLATLAFFLLCRQIAAPVPLTGIEVERHAVSLAVEAQQVPGSRIIGPEYTEITTSIAPEEAKRLSLHPDFAAVAARLLREAGVRGGSRVAVNMSGSFPALNIAVLAAIRASGATPVVVSSVGASTWGATDPEYTWLDMERSLVEAGIWPWRSAAASIGGVWDRGGGLSPEGIALARAAILRSNVPAVEPKNLEEAIASRMEIFKGQSGILPVALVNVGGSHVFFGTRGHRAPMKEGLTRPGGEKPPEGDGLGALFLRSGRPVIHFINVKRLAARYGIHRGAPAGSSEVFRTKTLPPAWQGAVALWTGAVVLLLGYGRRRGWWLGPVR